MKSFLPNLAAALLAAPLCLALPAAAETPRAPAKPDLKKGEAVAQVCMACHTADGSRGSPANPILQGQHPEYLERQLQHFKSGLRENAIMKGFASALSDEDMRHVAGFYASKQAKPGAAKNKELVQLGEQIWRGGIAAKAVPACAACHGPTGAGMPSTYPRLAGQHADYTAAQLNAYRAGTRKNNAQMVTIAAKLSDREIAALADYAAGLQ